MKFLQRFMVCAFVCFFHAKSIADFLIGNDLIDRPNRDTGSGSIFFMSGESAAGTLDQFGFFNNNVTGRQITPLIMKAEGTSYRITGIGTTQVSTGLGMQTAAFNLTFGSADFGLGYVLAFKDGANGVNNAGVAEYSENAGGTTHWFGAGKTSFALHDSFTPTSQFPRSYSIQGTLLDTGKEITGNALANRASNDTGSGNMFALNDPFSRSGTISQWSIYDDDVAGRQITPLLLRLSGATWEIIGIGSTRTSDASGAQYFSYDAISGTTTVDSDVYFGWKDGSNGTNNIGVADYQNITGGASVAWFGVQTSFSTGNFYTANNTFERTYSIEALAVPEPSTALLLSAGGLLLLRRMHKAPFERKA